LKIELNRTFLACIGVCLAAFVLNVTVLDVLDFTPFEYSEVIVLGLYLLPITFAFLRLQKRQIAYVASLSVILLALDLPLSPPGVIPWEMAVFNRTLEASMLSLIAFAYVHFKKLNEATQESEEKYRGLVENSASFIGILQDGILKYVNQAAVGRLGRTYDELVSPSFDPIEKVVAERFKGLIKENVGKRLSGEDVSPYEVSLITRDGSEIPVMVRATKIVYQGRPAVEFTFNDISERKRMEEELSRSSQFLGSVVENAYVWLDVLDSQQNVLVWNKAAETMSGYSREEVLGHGKIWEWLYPGQEYREQTTETVNDILQSGRTDVDTETRIKRKDGQTRIISWNERALTDQDGKTIGTIAIGHDITERKRAEENLRQSEERYHSLFDRTLDGMYRSTHEGRFVDVNPAFVKMFGYSSKQEVLDIKDIKKELYFAPEERGSHILDTGQEEVEVYRMRRKDGSEIWVEDHGGYVHDERGNIIYHEGLVRDFTERKRLEDELKQYALHLEELVDQRTRKLRESEKELRGSRERLEYIIGSNPAAIYTAKPRPDFSDYDAYYMSENVSSLTGFSAQEIIDQPYLWNQRIHSDDLTQFATEIPILWKEGRHTFEYRFLHKNGTYRWIREEVNVIRDSKREVRDLIGIWTDITEHKRLEDEIRRSQRLTAIGETAAMVGHDLRNPLQGIAGALHLLKQESLTEEERNEMLLVIEKSIHYSDAIIKDLSDYSAEIQLKLAEATPKSLTRDAIGAVKVPQNVTVQDLSEDQPTLRVDPDRMKRVFINLIENAIDAMPQGGTLTVSSRKFDGNVEIVLTDTGSGISEKVMKNLWKPLQTTKAKGLGLGLAICRRIVDAHGGSISVKSEVGRGTTLTMQLPIRPVEVTRK